MTAFVAGQAPASRPGLALAFRFALREMRGGLKGFYIFIACIALGVAAISGVTSVSRSLVEGIAAEGTTILGGDLSFRLIHREATQQEYAYLESLGAVSRIATLRAMARAPATGEQTLVEVKGVDDAYPLFGAMSLTAGGALDTALAGGGEAFGAVVERELLVRLGLSVGDSFTLGRATLTVSDTIEVEPDRLSDGLNFGPRVIVANAAIDASGLVQPGSLVRQNYRVRLDAPDRLDAIIEEAEEAFPEAGWRIRSRANAAPGLQRNIGRLAQFLSLVGMTALLVGGVGVANAVRSFLDAKRPVIATFRCVGADGGFVFRVYLIQILMLTGLGIACGLVLGAAIPFATQGFLATILPVQAIASIYPAELGLGVLYGALTALAFALWPLGRAHDVPPRLLFRDDVSTRHRWPRKRYIAGTALAVGVLAALAIWLSGDTRISLVYVGATASVFLLLSLIARAIMAGARRLPRPRGAELRLALGNIHRPGALTPSVVLSLGLGLSLLVTLALIDGNLRRELGATIARDAPSFFFLDVQNSERDAFDALLSREAPDATIDGAPMLRGRIAAINDIPSQDIEAPQGGAWALRGDRGITYAATLPDSSTLTGGDWWAPDHTGANLVSFESEVAEALGLKIGDTVTVNVLGRNITAEIANFRRVDWESLSINFVMVFSPNTFAGAPHTHLRTLTYPDGGTRDAELALLKTVANEFPTVTSIRVKDAIAQVNALVEQLAWAIRAAASVTLVSSVLVLGGALAAGHRHRVYDAVILKTLGATRARLIASFVIEYAALGLVTATFAVIAGALAASFVLVQVMDSQFTFLPATAIGAAIAALVLTVGFGLIGTWRVLGRKPAPVLRNL
ncbi:ABC transporter permease [Stappia stellulata]|uniref:ABC transporter permease n=1 Tax=Stappia stellulata TaxID=71235 RepID=UPI001CD3BDA5|nr:ABC transporter permease [Stappia stellulata]MCA1244120.1 ABC transporter permease [Stappia stellulata]